MDFRVFGCRDLNGDELDGGMGIGGCCTCVSGSWVRNVLYLRTARSPATHDVDRFVVACVNPFGGPRRHEDVLADARMMLFGELNVFRVRPRTSWSVSAASVSNVPVSYPSRYASSASDHRPCIWTIHFAYNECRTMYDHGRGIVLQSRDAAEDVLVSGTDVGAHS
ncbi:hypothetical protein BD410DRAFT_803759 [Rickenella mellea]|uniref:Uncharacterized protein n=1 Tax=Rickenella mellea TaxID=50990 RepID=A0A4Y7Q2P4_9AGAM|nr:hypothetical protein BD410DRAFT_803759 [Rickenella mellea]